MKVKMKKTTSYTKKTNEAMSDTDDVDTVVKSQLVFYQINNFIFGLISVFLLLRFFFRLSGANANAWIVSFVYSVSEVLMYPFRFIFPSQTVQGNVFEWSVLVALLLYMILGWIINRLLFIATTASVNNT